MLLHQGAEQYRVKALLDTGCSIALINEKTVEKLGITRGKHNQAYSIEGFTGESVEGAGQFYTDPTLLQHRKHYSREKFEISPIEAGIDIFLPFKWITPHPPQGAWDTDEVRFNSANCLKNCTKSESAEFSLSWDESVALDPSAHTIGYVAAVSDVPTDNVPMEFRQYLGIMGKEAADALPEHRPYDCKIDLREGATAPWGPIPPLRSRAADPSRMAQGDGKNRENTKVHVASGLTPPFCPKTERTRPPAMRGLSRAKRNHNP